MTPLGKIRIYHLTSQGQREIEPLGIVYANGHVMVCYMDTGLVAIVPIAELVSRQVDDWL